EASIRSTDALHLSWGRGRWWGTQGSWPMRFWARNTSRRRPEPGTADTEVGHPVPEAPGTRPGVFMFATGIECSAPVIAGRDGRRLRQDELATCGHYRSWREDLHLVRDDLGLVYLRYGPPLHRVWLGPGRYDWAFTDEVFAELRRLGIVPIVDL